MGNIFDDIEASQPTVAQVSPDASFAVHKTPVRPPNIFDQIHEEATAPTAYQQMLNGPAKGITNLTALPSTLANAVTSISVPRLAQQAGTAIAGAMGHQITPEQQASGDAVIGAIDAPRKYLHDTILPKIGLGPNVAEDFRAPLRSAGVIPKDPNYQPPAGIPRIADTMNEYAFGTAPAAALSDGASVLPGILSKVSAPLAAATGAGAVGGEVRNAMEGSPYEPIVEAVLSSLAIPAVQGARNLASGAGVGPLLGGGGIDPITGIVQPGKRLFGSNTDKRAVVDSFIDNVGDGVMKAKEAAGKTAATQQARDKFKQAAAQGTNGIVGAADELGSTNPLAEGGYQPMAGTASKNEGIQALESGLSAQPGMKIRQNENASAISQQATDALQPVGAAPGAAQTFLKNQGDTKIAGAKSDLTAAEKNAEAAKSNLDKDKAGVTVNAGSENSANASRKVAEDKANAMASGKKETSAAYDAVDGNAPINFVNTRNALRQADAMVTANEVSHPTIVQMLKTRGSKAQETAETGKIGTATIEGGGITTPFKEAQGDRRLVNGSLKSLENSTDPNAATHRAQLMMVKEGIDADLMKAGDSNDALRAANAKYAEESSLHKQGVSGEVAKPKSDPAQALDKYFSQPQGAQQLSKLVKAGKVSESDVRDYVVSKLAASSGNPTRATIQAFINKNGENLSNFPSIKSELIATRKSIASGEDASNTMMADVKAKQSALADTEKSVAGSDAGKFADAKSAHGEISNNLFKPGAHKYMEGLISEAKKDKTGAAMEGLKNSVREAQLDSLKNSGRLLRVENTDSPIENAELPTSLAKAVRMTKEGDTRKALEMLFTPDEMKPIDRVVAQIGAEGRGRMGKVAESNTTEKGLAAKLAEGAPYGSAGNSIRMINYITGLPGRFMTKDTDAFRGQILLAAALDPDKARALLKMPSAANIDKAKALFSPYLTIGNTESQDLQKEK